MKIVFYGNFGVDFSSESHHAKSLESLGHEVIRVQEPKSSANELLDKCNDADLFIWVHTHGWDTEHMAGLLSELKGMGVPSMTYHLDLYMGLDRWNEYKNSPLWDIEYFFTVDKLMAEHLNKNTDVKGYFIPAGVYDKECYIKPSEPTKNVIFVGSKGYHSEWHWRPKLIDWLKETYGDKFEHWGGDGLGVIRGDKLNQLYATTEIVIGDTLCKDFKYPNYFSDRLFETTGRGGFIIFPYIKGIEDYFEINEELVTYEFGNFADLKRKINYYLTHDKARERIRKAGHERTKNNHTYKHRWKEILEVINGRNNKN